MAERVHEIFQEERRACDENEQRQGLLIETEDLAEKLNEQHERHEPRRAAERKHQPHGHRRREQRNDLPDQRSLDEAEMIVDE
jgi:hypothetical protein